jgi:hypothetical protein
MKISKRQLKRIILEFWDKDVERFLIDNAAEYHRDPSLDARSIQMLLMDDFMDHVGHREDPARYKALINQLAAGETIAEAEGSTEKYDTDSALKGGQSKLPDGLQKGIIDKAIEDREDREEEEKNESMKITKRQLKRIIREAIDAREITIPKGLGGWESDEPDHPDFRDKSGLDVDLAKDKFKGYSQEAIDAAKYAVALVPYPQGALIENEIHSYLHETLGLAQTSDEIFNIADEALSVAGIMLDVGPDAL